LEEDAEAPPETTDEAAPPDSTVAPKPPAQDPP
jgi:hypothetical protein